MPRVSEWKDLKRSLELRATPPWDSWSYSRTRSSSGNLMESASISVLPNCPSVHKEMTAARHRSRLPVMAAILRVQTRILATNANIPCLVPAAFLGVVNATGPSYTSNSQSISHWTNFPSSKPQVYRYLSLGAK